MYKTIFNPIKYPKVIFILTKCHTLNFLFYFILFKSSLGYFI